MFLVTFLELLTYIKTHAHKIQNSTRKACDLQTCTPLKRYPLRYTAVSLYKFNMQNILKNT